MSTTDEAVPMRPVLRMLVRYLRPLVDELRQLRKDAGLEPEPEMHWLALPTAIAAELDELGFVTTGRPTVTDAQIEALLSDPEFEVPPRPTTDEEFAALPIVDLDEWRQRMDEGGR